MISPDDTLTTFLCHAIATNRQAGKTLTLVMPKFVALRPDFFCDLAESWRALRKRLSIGETVRLHVDCCDEGVSGGLISSWVRRIELARCRRQCHKRGLDEWVSLTRCLVISRPRDPSTSIVLGIAQADARLPEWTVPVTFRV